MIEEILNEEYRDENSEQCFVISSVPEFYGCSVNPWVYGDPKKIEASERKNGREVVVFSKYNNHPDLQELARLATQYPCAKYAAMSIKPILHCGHGEFSFDENFRHNH